MGLRQDIMAAVTSEEVDKLYQQGLKYEFASLRTRRSWLSTVNRRLKELDPTSHPKVGTGALKPQQVNRSKPKNAKNK